MIDKKILIKWLQLSAQQFHQQQDYLTDLDREIGDADHGLNMNRGFTKVIEKLPSIADKDIGTIFKTTGMTLLSQVGGASGPLFGTFFLKAAQPCNGKEELNLEEFFNALKQGMEGIQSRGRAELGDKTMLDVWIPILKEFEHHLFLDPKDLFPQLAEKAQGYAEATIPMLAKKGRASYLQERSIDHQDPGATSVALLFKTLAEAIND